MPIEEKRVDYLTADKAALLRGEADQADLRLSAVGMLRAHTASLRFSASAVTLAGGEATLSLSSGQLIAARHDVHLNNAGGQLLAAGNSIDVRNGGAGAMIARSIKMERGGVGLLFARHAELGEGVRVLMRPSGGVAFGAGALAGLCGGLLLGLRILRRR